MRRRCENPDDKDWRNYGERGIVVCERWDLFENFLEDMGSRPSLGHTIDRKDVNGNYEPGNCRWATATEQGRNRRNNRRIVVDGVEMPISEAAEKYGLRADTLTQRIELGWDVGRALAAPANRRDRVMLEFEGESLCVSAAARKVGMSLATLNGRLKTGWTVEEALRTPVAIEMGEKVMVNFDGVEMCLADASRAAGLTPNTVRGRLNRGWSVERALSTPPGPSRRRAA